MALPPSGKKPHVCPYDAVEWFDNLLRPLVHNADKMFGPFVKPGMTVLDVGCGRAIMSQSTRR